MPNSSKKNFVSKRFQSNGISNSTSSTIMRMLVGSRMFCVFRCAVRHFGTKSARKKKRVPVDEYTNCTFLNI